MKNALVSLILTVTVATASWAAAFVNITSREAREMMGKKQQILLLDVRTPDEYRQAHLKGAKLIPIDTMERRLSEIPKGAPIIVYCAVGSRSVPVANFLSKNGYKEVYNMSDGIVGWYRSGFPIER